MLKIKVLCIGKIKEKFYTQAVEEYLKRLSKWAKVEIIELPETFLTGKNEKDIENVVASEGLKILSKIDGFVVSFDLRGVDASSEELADKISSLMVGGVSTISFIIGGSYGLSKEVFKASDLVVRLGRCTFPHQLMRVIVVEQIYRSFGIIEGSSYHK